jgi:hypothetical protein
MKRRESRFELKLSSRQRQELDELASASGLTSSDVIRLCLRWLATHPDRLLRPLVEPEPEQQRPAA